jgi:anhydro-N-acetylmuramic acid kinase
MTAYRNQGIFMNDVIWALGIMSGTSMDGIDAAMLSTDGHSIQNFGKTFYQAYDDNDRSKIVQAVLAAKSLPTHILMNRNEWPEAIVEAEHFITQRHIDLLKQLNMKPAVVGIHGQTLIHRPEEKFSLQILDGQAVADATGLTIVHNMRANDIANGGQGAPMVPFYHFALAKRAKLTGPIAFLNIGGVSNVTWVNPEFDAADEEGAVLAFDTGTGVALLNDWIFEKTGKSYDEFGLISGKGTPNAQRLRQWSQVSYFEEAIPKSLDRDEFKRMVDVSDLSLEDGAATLCAFSAYGVERSLEWMPAPPVQWFICGGGRHNRALMQMLRQKLDTDVKPVDALGFDGDQIEAQAFGYLAARSLQGLSLSCPETTGCAQPTSGGVISYPVNIPNRAQS